MCHRRSLLLLLLLLFYSCLNVRLLLYLLAVSTT